MQVMANANKVVHFPKSAERGIDFPYFAELLKIVHKYDPNGRVSGGCLRDMILKRPIKDIDIFVHQSTVEDIDREFIINKGFSLTRSISGGYSFSDKGVSMAIDYTAPRGAIVSLIGLTKHM